MSSNPEPCGAYVGVLAVLAAAAAGLAFVTLAGVTLVFHKTRHL